VSWQFGGLLLLSSSPCIFFVHGPLSPSFQARVIASHARRSSQILSKTQHPVTAETKHRAVSEPPSLSFSPAFYAQIGHVRSPHSASRRAGFVFIPGSFRQPSRPLIQVLIDFRLPRDACFPRIYRYNMLLSFAEKTGSIK
jgi:hypothetical protein